MTDQELLAALAEKTPDELTDAEIEHLRRRLRDSAELREALYSQVQMEAYLATALARVNVSADDIVARAARHEPAQSSLRVLLPLIALPLVVVIAAALFFFRGQLFGPRRDDPLVVAKVVEGKSAKTATQQDQGTKGQDQADGQAEPAISPDGAVAPGKVGETPAPPAAGSGDPTADATTPAADATPPSPTTPWQEVLALQEEGDLPTFSEEAFRTFDVARQLPRRADLLAWFDAVPGHNHRVSDVDTQKGRCGQLDGLARLKSPWTADSALKLSLENYNKLQIHFFSGQQGVTLVYYEDQQYRWAAFATTRDPEKARPKSLAITATDDDRCRRTELRFGGPIEVRHRGGELILSRGNIVLLAAPLAGPPEEVYFEGRVAFHGIELVRTSGDPQPLSDLPTVFETARPVELSWTNSRPEIAQALPQADGSMRLWGDKIKERAECWTTLPSGLCEVVVELDDITPGAGVYLGTPSGEIHELIRFLHDRRSQELAVRGRGPDDVHEDQLDDYQNQPVPRVAKHCFLRMLFGAGNFRWWLSADGIHWAQVEMARDGSPGNRRTLGLQIVANRPDTQITLKRVVIRELSGLTALAPAEVCQRAPGFPLASSLGEWLTEVSQRQPADVDPGQWRRAAAIQTLGAGASRDLAYALLELLLDDAALRQLPAAEQLAALNDAMLLVWDLRDGQAMRVGLLTRYVQLGREAYEREGLPPWSTIQHSLMSVPLVSWQQQPLAAEANLRFELIDSVTRRQSQQTLQLARQWRFFQLQQQVPLLDWSEAAARRDAPGATAEGVTRLKEGWRPLLVEEVSRESYNAMTEVQSVLESEAWEDAAQMITAYSAEAAAGVAPWPEDKDHLVSLPVAIRLTLDRYPQLRQSLESRFSPLAELRITQAIAAGDAAAVELATIQFAGTQAAAEAHRWLADQALASGWFERALAEYGRAIAAAPALERELSPRVRLAAAMLGRDSPSPVDQSVRLGEVVLSKEQFEALIAEMRSRPPTSQLASVEPRATIGKIPPPTALQAQVKSRLDGPVGDKPQEEVVRRTGQFRVPWADRQIATVLEGDLLYVANRFQVAAYNLASGQRLWQSPPPPGPMGPAQDWASIAMRPLVTATHLFVRQLYGSGPQLVCLHKQSGQIAWTASPSEREFFASDPLLIQGRLVLLSIELAEGQEGRLKWNAFDPGTGERQAQRDLLRLRSTWGAHACCEVTALDDSLVAILGGVSLAADARGSVKWIRKHVVLPAEEEPRWILQRYQPPLIDGERMFVAQPGVRAVESLHPRTGTRQWLAVIPDLLGISGLVGDNLIVWTEADLRGLDAATGKTLWRHPIADLHNFQVCGPGVVVYARREPAAGTSNVQTRLVWLDPATGQELGASVLPNLTDPDPRLGPLVVYKDRIWTFFGRGQHDPTRDLVELVPAGEPARPLPALLAVDLWLRHVPTALSAPALDLLPQWQVLSGQGGDRTGLVADAHGEKNVLGLRANPQWPVALSRPVAIPPSIKARLRLRVANDAGHHWKLEVRFGERTIQAVDVTDAAFPDRWKTVEVDLSSLAGQSGTLVICGRFVSGGGNETAIFVKSADLLF